MPVERSVVNIRDRVRDFRRVRRAPSGPVRSTGAHPKAQIDVLKGLLAELGFAGAVLVRELPGGALEAINGHLRLDTTGR